MRSLVVVVVSQMILISSAGAARLRTSGEIDTTPLKLTEVSSNMDFRHAKYLDFRFSRYKVLNFEAASQIFEFDCDQRLLRQQKWSDAGLFNLFGKKAEFRVHISTPTQNQHWMEANFGHTQKVPVEQAFVIDPFWNTGRYYSRQLVFKIPQHWLVIQREGVTGGTQVQIYDLGDKIQMPNLSDSDAKLILIGDEKL